MKWLITLLMALQVTLPCASQVQFRTILPNEEVVTGESFPVQYVINSNETSSFSLPVYHGFRVVSGPAVYHGGLKGGKSVTTNFMVTIVAGKAGRYMIPGATVMVNGKYYRSNDNFIEVIPKKPVPAPPVSEAASGYYLAPGENVDDKLKQNLFVKVKVDKKKCYVGEAVTATFKLYSRLESRSDIVKNPGFYGFTVYDVVNLADRMVSTEVINGKTFDVHTIRKVQLFPLRAGHFQVDPMEVRNTVEFSRSIVNRKAEQEVREGVLNSGSGEHARGSEIAENEISTEAVPVEVMPLPETGRPQEYAGAVGDFRISSGITKKEISKNEKCVLQIIVSGKGNFTQLNALPVSWPAGVEGFDPLIEDSIDKSGVELRGYRIFRYPFIVSSADSFSIPPIKFAFFNPDTGRYKTVQSERLAIAVNGSLPALKQMPGDDAKPVKRSVFPLVIAAVILIVTLITLSRYRKKSTTGIIAPEVKDPAFITAGEAIQLVKMDGSSVEFYSTLLTALDSFLRQRTGAPGNKNVLAMLNAIIVNSSAKKRLGEIISEAESAVYTGAEFYPDKNKLAEDTRELLAEIEQLTPNTYTPHP